MGDKNDSHEVKGKNGVPSEESLPSSAEQNEKDAMPLMKRILFMMSPF